MIRFTRIEIENFVCFDNLLVEPSINPERPLTVIRAENESGKTTFLRAVRWGMYGEGGLPNEGANFGVHPTFWEPDQDGITTRVAIEFTSDGSTRHENTGAAGDVLYRLERTVRTISKAPSGPNGADYQRLHQSAQLMKQDIEGGWEAHTLGVDHVIEQLLPWELRDFFVMDADEASEFVGGMEAKTISRSDVERKTTYAIDALLGIKIFREASKRVNDAGNSFGSKATKAVGDSDLDALQLQLDEARRSQDELKTKIADDNRTLTQKIDARDIANEKLADQLKCAGALEELQNRRESNERERSRALNDHKNALSALAGLLESPSLIASLGSKATTRTYDTLKPEFEAGKIPQRHVAYIKGLLETGTCVCGQDLSTLGEHRSHVEQQITDSATDAKYANYLGYLFEAARSLHESANKTTWTDEVAKAQTALAQAKNTLSEVDAETRDIDSKLKAIANSEIHVIKSELDALEQQINQLRAKLASNEHRLPELRSEIDSLNKQLQARQNSNIAAISHRRSEDLAKAVGVILANAYDAIRQEQVSELSSEMNRLFTAMVDNVSEEDIDHSQIGKESIRTIAEVGVRPVGENHFEIFAVNNYGRDKPHIEINGASRRVIALSFVLALCTESNTRAPLVADSLLNMMSGAVRRNTLRTTAERSGQPILLLTGDDLLAHSEIETARDRAGATYTLTAQWHAGVVHQTDLRAVSLICSCGPQQFCDICERQGQANTPGWAKRA